mgnify:CR=1 FL=1
MLDTKKIDENSMLYWYPKIKNLNIPQPRTEIVEVNESIFDLLDGKLPRNIDEIKRVARKIGYPLFMRTDHLSGKHEWKYTCYVETEKDLIPHISNLVESSAMAGIVGLPINALVFRELLKLDYAFKAFNGLPIARERRVFIKDGNVQCIHAYWVEDAIRFWEAKEPEGWRKKLRELNTVTDEEVEILTEYAEIVGQEVKGYWSVDFAKSGEKWYLIDMAKGEDSWHPPCEYKLTRDERGA